MLKLPLLEFFFRGIPEESLLIFAVYAFSKTIVDVKKYVMSSILLIAIVYLIRFLPIQFGVHTILNLIVMILLTVNINKIEIIKAIKASIIAIILESICEGINIFIIQYIFKLDINSVFKDPILKILYGIPSLLIFACAIGLYYHRFLKKRVEGCF
jgi:hypothetical protein